MTDVLDYPTAWEIQRRIGTKLEHHPRCSSVPGWDPISGPGFLCDCGAIVKEWERSRAVSSSLSPSNVGNAPGSDK